MIKQAIKAAVIAAAVAGAVSAYAAPWTLKYDSNNDGIDDATVTNFAGIDWSSNGTAISSGFNNTLGVGVAQNTSLVYYATADAIKDLGGVTIPGPTLAMISGFNEYTILANMTETSTCTLFVGTCLAADFVVKTGTFSVWYDTTPDANMATGAGITDGVLLMSGTFNPGPSGGFNLVTNTASSTLKGQVNFTNSTFITPDLIGTAAVTTLQIGGINQTGWVGPLDAPGAGGASGAAVTCGLSSPASICLQADANQAFVPEPGTLALVGAALAGIAGLRRRKSA